MERERNPRKRRKLARKGFKTAMAHIEVCLAKGDTSSKWLMTNLADAARYAPFRYRPRR